MYVPPPPSEPRAPESTLVHGTDESAVSAVAVGLALRRNRSFAWADCAPPVHGGDRATHQLFRRGSGQPVFDRVDESALRPPSWTWRTLEQLYVPDRREEEERLARYLRMPELFQRLIAYGTTPDGGAVILLANVDAIPPAARAHALEPRGLHEVIHHEGVTFVATSRERPSPGMVEVFDRVLRVDVPDHGQWSDGCLTVEKGEVPNLRVDPCPLWEAWDLLGLDPGLLVP
jgi:hypothetical protein